MLHAALWSAWSWNPHATHANARPQPGRFSGSTTSHVLQRRLVFFGGTFTKVEPNRSTL